MRDTTSHHRRRLSGGGVRVEGARMRSRGPRARSRRGACPCVTCHRPSRRRRFGNFRRGDQASMAQLFDNPPPPRRRGSCPRPDSEQGPAALLLIASPRTEPLNSAAGNISPERGRGGGIGPISSLPKCKIRSHKKAEAPQLLPDKLQRSMANVLLLHAVCLILKSGDPTDQRQIRSPRATAQPSRPLDSDGSNITLKAEQSTAHGWNQEETEF